MSSGQTTGQTDAHQRVAANLRRIRAECGYSQWLLALMADVDPVRLRDWEDGRRLPNVRHLVRLADALECRWTDFYGL